jgi:nucleotide-binding universal stress UspA family protein
MYNKILVGYDGSEHADDALALASVLKDALGLDVVVGGVIDYEPIGGLDTPAPRDPGALRVEALERLQPVGDHLGAAVEATVTTSAARGLSELATKTGSDLIVIGSCHRGSPGRVLAGSAGERLLQGAPCAVAIAPARYGQREHYGLRTVACGFVPTDESRKALDLAARIARGADAVLRIVSVAPVESMLAGKGLGIGPVHEAAEAASHALKTEVSRAQEDLPEDVRVEASVAHGHPVEELAVTEADLLVVGSRRYGPIRTVMLGGVSLPLIRSARLPVLVAGPEVTDQHEAGPPGAAAGRSG